VTFFENSRHNEPEAPLAAEVVAYYRRVLLSHADDPDSGVCRVCQVARCADWRDAFDKLALAGEVMVEAGRWDERPRP
jgi:hypothetical protein